jgi:hypothetical protein
MRAKLSTKTRGAREKCGQWGDDHHYLKSAGKVLALSAAPITLISTPSLFLSRSRHSLVEDTLGLVGNDHIRLLQELFCELLLTESEESG